MSALQADVGAATAATDKVGCVLRSCAQCAQAPAACSPPLSLFLMFPGMCEYTSHTLGVRPSLSHAPSTCTHRPTHTVVRCQQGCIDQAALLCALFTHNSTVYTHPPGLHLTCRQAGLLHMMLTAVGPAGCSCQGFLAAVLSRCAASAMPVGCAAVIAYWLSVTGGPYLVCR